MNTINERIKILIDHQKISHNAFAKSLGKSSTAINFLVKGEGKPSFDVLEAIIDQYKISPAWLLKGEGQMFAAAEAQASAGPVDKDYLVEHLERLEQSFSRLINQLEAKDRQIENLIALLGKLDPAADQSKVFPLWVILEEAA
jgi:transcriptional regulator with XRE-family HTH domain